MITREKPTQQWRPSIAQNKERNHSCSSELGLEKTGFLSQKSEERNFRKKEEPEQYVESRFIEKSKITGKGHLSIQRNEHVDTFSVSYLYT